MDLRKIIKMIDRIIGNFIISFLYIVRPIKYFLFKPKTKQVLVIRLWALGESLHTLPMIKYLKDEGYKVDVVVTRYIKEVFRLSNLVDNIMDLNVKLLLKFLKYDYVIDSEPYSRFSAILSFFLGKRTIGFSNLYRSKAYDYKVNYDDRIHSVYNYNRLLQTIGINKVADRLIALNYSNTDRKVVDQLLHTLNIGSKILIGIHLAVGSTTKYRMWKLNRWAELIKRVLKNYDNIVIYLTGTSRDKKVNNSIIEEIKSDCIINLAGKLDLPQLSYLLTKTKLFISNDTGPMHLASAMGCKTIGLFGPNLPIRFSPFPPDKHIAIYKASNLRCSPCINVHIGQFKKCKLDGKCMDQITVDEVFSKIKKEIYENKEKS